MGFQFPWEVFLLHYNEKLKHMSVITLPVYHSIRKIIPSQPTKNIITENNVKFLSPQPLRAIYSIVYAQSNQNVFNIHEGKKAHILVVGLVSSPETTFWVI